MPLDPNAEFDGPSEYSWGPGMFPPGIANNEGQTRPQDDFGDNLTAQTTKIGGRDDNYARAVADRRTDSLDPDSNRDFETCGNTDRYGAAPPLVRADPQRNKPAAEPVELNRMRRRW